MESDERRGIGKVYEIFIGKKFDNRFSRLMNVSLKTFFVGNFSAYFTVTKLEDGKSITLETDSYFLLLSSISITFHELCGSSALQIQHHFNIKSMLFHNTLGVVFRKFLEKRLQRALGNLKMTLCKLEAEKFLL